MKRGDVRRLVFARAVFNRRILMYKPPPRSPLSSLFSSRGVRSSSVAHLLPGAYATGAEYVEGAAGWPYTGCGAYWGCCPYCGCIAIGAGACMAYWGCAPPWMA